jgi:hypothetical protein
MASGRQQEDARPNEPAWHPDPFQRHQARWWDGAEWTGRVRDGATIGIDPPVIDTRPEADVPVAPAAPIHDAVQPLPRTNWAAIISLGIGVLVVVGLVVMIVLSV